MVPLTILNAADERVPSNSVYPTRTTTRHCTDRVPAQVDPKFLGVDLHREKRLSVSLPSNCVTARK